MVQIADLSTYALRHIRSVADTVSHNWKRSASRSPRRRLDSQPIALTRRARRVTSHARSRSFRVTILFRTQGPAKVTDRRGGTRLPQVSSADR